MRGGLIRTATGEVVVHRDFDANVIAMKHQIARSHHADNPPGNSINAGQWRLSLKSLAMATLLISGSVFAQDLARPGAQAPSRYTAQSRQPTYSTPPYRVGATASQAMEAHIESLRRRVLRGLT